MASKVISVDPWWNQSVEQQGMQSPIPLIIQQTLNLLAFCRVFRIGQSSETHCTRFIVRNTIDERMRDLQIRKQQEIDPVLGENANVESKYVFFSQKTGPLER